MAALNYFTSGDWTVKEYVVQTTTQVYTIFDDSTPLATIQILPTTGYYSSGGVLFQDGSLLFPYYPAETVDRVLLSISGTRRPSFYYSRIDGISSISPTPDSKTTTSLPLTSVRFQTSGDRSGITAFPISPLTSEPTPTASVSATSGTDGELVNGENLPDVAEKYKLNGGVIAGITIGVIAAFLFLLGAFIVLRRRRRSRGSITDESDDNPTKRESDKMVVGADEALYQNHNPHMSYYDNLQELYPPQPHTFSMHAHELKAYTTPGELSRHHCVSMSQPSPIDGIQDCNIEPTTEHIVVAPSPHVRAQRIRELEWLDMEEAKLRQRREQLIRQSGEHVTGSGDLQ
jgi:hypothetical protein